MPTKPEPWDEGDEITLGLNFTDAADAPKNPDAPTLELHCPDGTLFTWLAADLTHPSTGRYERVYVIANGSGRYLAIGRGTGVLPIVQKRYFMVRA